MERRLDETYAKILAKQAVGLAEAPDASFADAYPPPHRAPEPERASEGMAGAGIGMAGESAEAPPRVAVEVERMDSALRIPGIAEVERFTVAPHLRVVSGTRVAEEYRALRTNVRTLRDTQGVHVLAVTSCHHAEGKTSTTINLARFVAKNEKNRVLLVDCDLRRPKVAKFLGLEPKVGLEDVLEHGLPPEQALVHSVADNLTVLPARRGTGRASELLESPMFGAVIDRMRRFFDFVFVDTPPLLSTTDPAIIGSRVDGMALLVRAGGTQRESVVYARNLLEQARVNVVGMVLCRVRDYLPKSRYLYRYHYYRDYYDYYETYGGGEGKDHAA